eukprot:12904650-Prorocentrum_lima.AAC.1
MLIELHVTSFNFSRAPIAACAMQIWSASTHACMRAARWCLTFIRSDMQWLWPGIVHCIH